MPSVPHAWGRSSPPGPHGRHGAAGGSSTVQPVSTRDGVTRDVDGLDGREGAHRVDEDPAAAHELGRSEQHGELELGERRQVLRVDAPPRVGAPAQHAETAARGVDEHRDRMRRAARRGDASSVTTTLRLPSPSRLARVVHEAQAATLDVGGDDVPVGRRARRSRSPCRPAPRRRRAPRRLAPARGTRPRPGSPGPAGGAAFGHRGEPRGITAAAHHQGLRDQGPCTRRRTPSRRELAAQRRRRRAAGWA